MNFLTKDRRGEAICLLLLLATGVALLVGAAALPEPMFDPLGPAGLPRYVGYLLLVLLALRLVSLFRESRAAPAAEADAASPEARRPAGAGTGEGPQRLRFALVALITLAYLTALTVGGLSFTWLTLAFLAALGAAMSDLSARKLIIVGVISAVMSFALTYTFTDVLSVVLPE
ncbi:Tripartite tricarboxylate transporter TctB family [Marinovum algicola DG 898]|nr:Tripartite tricarboxylate transporter TctB family [Marinovum algicola DG 898]